MAYHGYIPFMHQFLNNFKNPKILEIGVCDGITTFALTQRLINSHSSFTYDGVDILIRPSVVETIKYMIKTNDHVINLINENSSNFLEKTESKYDLILIDGDHNYHTVFQELSYIDKLINETTIIICDDYFGRWAEKDLLYSERDEYKDNIHATKTIDTSRHGVKNAIDDFIKLNNDWNLLTLIPGEPVLLIKNNNVLFNLEKNE